ncbi:hypothetical protein Pa4123_05360 [Phytohabitans aurantiacus]|uniref:Uncharacterized protein n=1 Tax=Phytohabitans aurantiacus TaxID=3016789 RepID=A0ABQ5QND7_9ACTN|nr:hypothetical protein Pa4123_05360 [Phytohabitans aurantiacus]
MKSTSDTANENFITDHGSMRLTFRRARLGPREAADATVLRAARTASPTRAAPTAPAVRTEAPPAAVRPTGWVVFAAAGAPGATPGRATPVAAGAPAGGALTGALAVAVTAVA